MATTTTTARAKATEDIEVPFLAAVAKYRET